MGILLVLTCFFRLLFSISIFIQGLQMRWMSGDDSNVTSQFILFYGGFLSFIISLILESCVRINDPRMAYFLLTILGIVALVVSLFIGAVINSFKMSFIIWTIGGFLAAIGQTLVGMQHRAKTASLFVAHVLGAAGTLLFAVFGVLFLKLLGDIDLFAASGGDYGVALSLLLQNQTLRAMIELMWSGSCFYLLHGILFSYGCFTARGSTDIGEEEEKNPEDRHEKFDEDAMA